MAAPLSQGHTHTPASAPPALPAQGGVSSGKGGNRKVPWRPGGTWPSVRLPFGAMGTVAPGSGWPLGPGLGLLLQLAALLGTLGPQVRAGRGGGACKARGSAGSRGLGALATGSGAAGQRGSFRPLWGPGHLQRVPGE